MQKAPQSERVFLETSLDPCLHASPCRAAGDCCTNSASTLGGLGGSGHGARRRGELGAPRRARDSRMSGNGARRAVPQISLAFIIIMAAVPAVMSYCSGDDILQRVLEVYVRPFSELWGLPL